MPSEGGRELGNEVTLKPLGWTQRHGQERKKDSRRGKGPEGGR